MFIMNYLGLIRSFKIIHIIILSNNCLVLFAILPRLLSRFFRLSWLPSTSIQKSCPRHRHTYATTALCKYVHYCCSAWYCYSTSYAMAVNGRKRLVTRSRRLVAQVWRIQVARTLPVARLREYGEGITDVTSHPITFFSSFLQYQQSVTTRMTCCLCLTNIKRTIQRNIYIQ